MTALVLVLIVLLGRETLAMTSGLSRAGGGAQNVVEIAIGQYLARCLRGAAGDDPCTLQGEAAPIFYAPAAVLDHPATRLLLGNAAGAERVRVLDPAVDLLPATTPTGDLFYLVALDNQPVIELLQQLYPTAQLRAEPRDQVGPTLFLVVQIARADALAHQGLQGRLYAGSNTQGEPVALRQDGPLQFAWGSEPPMSSPFSGVWEGSLLVPAAGSLYLCSGDNRHWAGRACDQHAVGRQLAAGYLAGAGGTARSLGARGLSAYVTLFCAGCARGLGHHLDACRYCGDAHPSAPHSIARRCPTSVCWGHTMRAATLTVRFWPCARI